MSTGNENTIILFGAPGSQFTSKVLVALDARKIPHYVEFVSFNPSARTLPSGGRLVPELLVCDPGGKTVANIPDSEAILHWIDDNGYESNFFPSKQASEVSTRASDGVLAGCVLYYNWVDQEGYEKTMKKVMDKNLLPSFVPIFRGEIIDFFTASTRTKYKTKVAEMLGLDAPEDVEDGSRVKRLLLEELTYFQSLVQSSGQSYLLAGGEPTAADFSVYAQLERLVGDMGDIQALPSLPDLKSQHPELKRFWEWHEHMRATLPVKFKGKRRPKQK